MKLSRRQLRQLIIESWGDKLFGMIDPTFHDEQDRTRAIATGDPVIAVEKAINALIPLSLDYRDASDALTSLRRLKKQLDLKSLQEMSSRFPPGREPGFKSTMKPFSLGSLPTDTISSSEDDYYSGVDDASVDDYYGDDNAQLVKAAADYLEEGIRSSIEFADHPSEADPEFQIRRAVEAMQYETSFTDVMFPGVDLDNVEGELMRRFRVSN